MPFYRKCWTTVAEARSSAFDAGSPLARYIEAMTNAFGVVVDRAAVRWAPAEGVTETVIAAVLLLNEMSVDEVVAKLRPGELEQVIKLVGRSPRCSPPGMLDALKRRTLRPAPDPIPSISTTIAASARPTIRIKPSADDMRRAHERRLAIKPSAEGAGLGGMKRTPSKQ
jgi:hypothetical protein